MRFTLAAIRWLSVESREEDVVLSSPMVAPYIPVISHNRMYFGNYEAPTADFAQKYEAVRQHLLRRRSDEFVSFLRTERIACLFYDQHLAELGAGSAWLDSQPALQRVLDNTAVKIYRVLPQ